MLSPNQSEDPLKPKDLNSDEGEDDSDESTTTSDEFEVGKLLDICYGDPNKTKKRGLYFKVSTIYKLIILVTYGIQSIDSLKYYFVNLLISENSINQLRLSHLDKNCFPLIINLRMFSSQILLFH